MHLSSTEQHNNIKLSFSNSAFHTVSKYMVLTFHSGAVEPNEFTVEREKSDKTETDQQRQTEENYVDDVTVCRIRCSHFLTQTYQQYTYFLQPKPFSFGASFRRPNPDHSFSHSSQSNSLSSSVPSSPLSLSITPTLFQSKLKRYLFLKSFPPQTPPLSSDCRYGHRTAQWLSFQFFH